jgi:hypothetical protein
VVRALSAQFDLIFLSGRSNVCREETMVWLHKHVQVGARPLFMRRRNDYRSDTKIKEEIFWQFIAPSWAIRGVLDDRDSVVTMWRRLGLVCLQVAPGDF